MYELQLVTVDHYGEILIFHRVQIVNTMFDDILHIVYYDTIDEETKHETFFISAYKSIVLKYVLLENNDKGAE